jgi:hypothetical protein
MSSPLLMGDDYSNEPQLREYLRSIRPTRVRFRVAYHWHCRLAKVVPPFQQIEYQRVPLCRTLVLFDAAIRAIEADFFWSVSLLHRTRGDKCSHRRVRALELRSIVRRRLEQSPHWETLRLRKRPETFLAFRARHLTNEPGQVTLMEGYVFEYVFARSRELSFRLCSRTYVPWPPCGATDNSAAI